MSISYTIRKWAADNKRYAQGLIALCTVVLFYLGHVLGVLADMLGWDPYALFLIGACTGLLAWTLAPRRGDTFPIRYTYARQKVATVIMLSSICIGLGGWAICLENFEPPSSIQNPYQQVEAIIGPQFSQKAETGSKVEKALTNWFHGGISKRVTKRVRKALKKITPLSPTSQGKVFSTILVLLFAFSLAGLMGMLSCGLSCNGHIALSYIVLIGGIGLIILAATLIIRKIHGR